MSADFSEYYSGKRLYGDDFSPQQIEEWFKEEESGYYDLAVSSENNPQENYPYAALNDVHGYRHISGRQFKCCFGLGVGSGEDVRQLAPQVDRFYCVEPARAWWTPEVFGKPATFAMPNLDGRIDLPDRACDLAVAMAVLHHIPNVTAILTEISRVLQPGGLLLMREPIVTMGEWGAPRPGLTKNERGIPIEWLRHRMASLGFVSVNEQLYSFRPFILAMGRVFGKNVFESPSLTRVDAFLCGLTASNARYHRPSFLGKFAPAAIFGIYEKR